MPWVAAAAAAAAAVGGAAMQSNAADNASAAQTQGTIAGINASNNQFNQTRQDQAPWLSAGGAGVTTLASLLGLPQTESRDQIYNRLKTLTPGMQANGLYDPSGARNEFANYFERGGGAGNASPIYRWDEARLNQEADRLFKEQQANIASGAGGALDSPLLKSFTPQDLENEPGYKFGLEQGNKGLENAARARGMYYSPSTVKELLRYGQDYAGTKYNDAYNRYNTTQTNQYNRLAGISGTGQNAANTLAATGSANAGNVSNLITSGANARGAAGIAGANAWGNALTGAGNNAMQAATLNSLFNRPGTGPNNSGYGLWD